MKKSKILVVIISILLICCLSLVLVACGGNDSSNNNGGNGNNNGGTDNNGGGNNGNGDNIGSGIEDIVGTELFEFSKSPNGYILTKCLKKDELKITIPNQYQGKPVTSIGDMAFKDCTKLTSISIPNSIASIGANAFTGCDKLQYNEYDDALYLGNSENLYLVLVKAKSTSITSCTINENTRLILDAAFRNCYNLVTISIPNSVTSIGANAFTGCDKLQYNEYDNALYLGNSDNLYLVLVIAKSTRLTSCTINENTRLILDAAFDHCTDLESVTIGNNVTTIGNYAFQYCDSLKNITIPNSVTTIGVDAFVGCNSLESITMGSSVTTIDNQPFKVCWSLTSIVVAEDNSTYKSENNCLLSKDGTTLILGCKNSIIPNSVTNIGDWAFASCTGLTSLTIPESVTTIGNDAFFSCSGIAKIVVEENNSTYKSENNCLLSKDGTTLILGCKNSIIPNSVTTIGVDAFHRCSDLTSITIPNSVTKICDWAFYDCTNLKNITIPNNVDIIGEYAFVGCNSLTIYCETSSKPIGWNSNWNSNWGNNWNENCPVVWNCKNNDVADNGYIYIVIDGIRYGLKDGNATVVRQPSSIIGDIIIPQTVEYKDNSYNVTSIGDYAFDNFRNLTFVTIPNSVISIGNYAFRHCYNLESVTIGNNVTTIGKYAFSVCNNLVTITIPNSVTTIGDYAFEFCTELTSVTIGNNVTTIGNYAFHYCCNLVTITIPKSVTSIGDYAFYECGNLTIYCEIEYELSTWDSNWNILFSDGDIAYCTVVFDCNNNKYIVGNGFVVIDNVMYAIENGGAIVYGPYEDLGGEINILSTIKYRRQTYNVTCIKGDAFAYFDNLTTINYNGTMAQWNAIDKDNWNYATGNLTIVCTDGKLDKNGDEIE